MTRGRLVVLAFALAVLFAALAARLQQVGLYALAAALAILGVLALGPVKKRLETLFDEHPTIGGRRAARVFWPLLLLLLIAIVLTTWPRRSPPTPTVPGVRGQEEPDSTAAAPDTAPPLQERRPDPSGTAVMPAPSTTSSWPLEVQLAVGQNAVFEISSYSGPCENLAPGLQCVTYPDGFVLLVVDSLTGRTTTRGSRFGEETVGKSAKYADYYHDLGTSRVMAVRNWRHTGRN